MNLNDPFISALDRKIIEFTGYGKRRGFGNKPALMIIDAQNKFVGIDAPILDSVATYPLSIGEKAWKAMPKISEMLEAGRRKRVIQASILGTPRPVTREQCLKGPDGKWNKTSSPRNYYREKYWQELAVR